MSIKSFETRWAQAPSRVLTWLGNRFIARTGELGMPEDFYAIPADRTVPSPSELERSDVQRHQIGVDYMRREILQHTGRLVGAISAWLYIALTAAVMLTAAIVSKPFNAFGFTLSILVFLGLGFALLVAAKVWKRNSGSGVTGLRLGRLIPIKEIRSEAVKEAKIVCGRYDAPQALPDGAKIPADLHDTKGKFFRAADGTSLTSRMLTEDLLGTISPSPAAPLLLVGLPLFAVLVFFATAGMVALPQLQAKAMMSGAVEATVTALAITGIVAVLGVLSMVGYRVYVASLSMRELASSAIFTAAFILAWMVALTLAGQPQMAAGVYGPIAGLVAIVVAILGIVALFAKETRNKWFKRMGWALAIGVAAASGPFGLFASAAAIGLLPLLYCRGVKLNRTMELAERNAKYAGEETGPNVLALREARTKQAELAAKDTSPFVQLGEATGTFANNGDTFGPDEGKPVGLTQNDLSTHIIVLGGTGSGKTSRALRPLLAQVIRNNLRAGAEHRCGLALFDGKGSLPGECRGIPDYMLIEGPQGDAESPPVKLGLIEGLDATTIAYTLRTVFTTGQEQGNSGHFYTLAEKHIRMCATMLAALKTIHPSDPNLSWTIASLNHFTKVVANANALPQVTQWCDMLEGAHPDAKKRGSLLSQAIQHCKVDVHSLGEDEKGSMNSTASNWLQPLMSNPKLIEWSMTEEGVDPTVCLKGGYVGVSLPEAAYGSAGKAIAALVKARIMKGVKKRGGDSDWRKNNPEATDVIIMVDECQDLINKEDQALLPVARSLGAKCVYATQNIEGLKAKLGPNDAAALLGQFRSTISFVATEETLKHVSDEMGVSRRLVSSIQTIIPDFIGTATTLAGRMMFDPRTPGYESMRWLREGGGVSVTSQGHGHVSEWDGPYGRDHKAYQEGKAKRLAMPQTYRRWIDDKPVFDRPDWTLLANPTHAVASFNRAGVPRRDVIVTQQVFNMTDVLDLPQQAEEEVAEAA